MGIDVESKATLDEVVDRLKAAGVGFEDHEAEILKGVLAGIFAGVKQAEDPILADIAALLPQVTRAVAAFETLVKLVGVIAGGYDVLPRKPLPDPPGDAAMGKM